MHVAQKYSRVGFNQVVYVTWYEKTGLTYTKYTYTRYIICISFIFKTLELCKLQEIPYEILHKLCKYYCDI